MAAAGENPAVNWPALLCVLIVLLCTLCTFLPFILNLDHSFLLDHLTFRSLISKITNITRGDEIAALTTALSSKTSETLKLKARIADLERLKTKHEDDSAATIARLTEKREETSQRLRSAQMDLFTIRQDADALVFANEAIRSDLDAFTARTTILQHANADLQDSYDSLLWNYEGLDRDCGELRAEKRQLQQHVDDLQARNEDLKRANADWFDAMHALYTSQPGSSTPATSSIPVPNANTPFVLTFPVLPVSIPIPSSPQPPPPSPSTSPSPLFTAATPLPHYLTHHPPPSLKPLLKNTAHLFTTANALITSLRTELSSKEHVLAHMRAQLAEQADEVTWRDQIIQQMRAVAMRREEEDREGKVLLQWLSYCFEESGRAAVWEGGGFPEDEEEEGTLEEGTREREDGFEVVRVEDGEEGV